MALGRSNFEDRFENPREILGDRLRRVRSIACWPTTAAALRRRLLRRSLRRVGPGSTDHAGPGDGDGDDPPGLRGPRDAEAFDRLSFDLAGRRPPGSTPATSLPSDVPRRPAQPPARLGASPAALRRHQGGCHRDRGDGPGPGCSTRPRSTTPWRPKTPSPSCARRSASCSAPSTAAKPLGRDAGAALERDDAVCTVGKPPCDWDDASPAKPSSTPSSVTAAPPWGQSTARLFKPGQGRRRAAGPRGRPRHRRGR